MGLTAGDANQFGPIANTALGVLVEEEVEIRALVHLLADFNCERVTTERLS